jgi:hypothetical protein
LKVLGSRGESEKEREMEEAAEKERLKAAAIAKAGDLITFHALSCIIALQEAQNGRLKVPGKNRERQPVKRLRVKAATQKTTSILMKKKGWVPQISVRSINVRVDFERLNNVCQIQ